MLRRKVGDALRHKSTAGTKVMLTDLNCLEGLLMSEDKMIKEIKIVRRTRLLMKIVLRSSCARFQVTPKTSHLLAVKRIFRYLKGKTTLGLWYSRDSPFELVAYTDSDYAGATQDRKSTTRDLLTKGFDAGRHVKSGRDTKIPQSSSPPVKVGEEAVHKELGDRMKRAATTSSSLEAEQDSGSGPRCQDTILGDVDAQTRFETTSKQSNDPPLSRGYTLGSRKDSMKLLELMELPNLVMPVQVNAAEGDSINTSI
ncbi:hypothetical protein Tco_1417781 [Tanacetum coccineum]